MRLIGAAYERAVDVQELSKNRWLMKKVRPQDKGAQKM